MKDVKYTPTGVCAKEINFTIENNTITNVSFERGCEGNLKAISKLLEGQDVNLVIEMLEGNTCKSRPTSCTDQLVQAIKENI